MTRNVGERAHNGTVRIFPISGRESLGNHSVMVLNPPPFLRRAYGGECFICSWYIAECLIVLGNTWEPGPKDLESISCVYIKKKKTLNGQAQPPWKLIAKP